MTTYRLTGSFARRRQCGDEEDLCHTPIPIDSARIIYNGPNLPGSGVLTGDTLDVALQKLDDKIASALQQLSELTP